jgi:hypothetical protein
MKKIIWLLLVLLVAIAVMVSSGFFREHQAALPVVEKMPVESPQPQWTKLLVSPDKLLTHVQKLNFQRYTTAERSHTRAYITSELQKSGWDPQLEEFAEGVNIVAQRPGTDPNAGTILVAAHYDTVPFSPGADDNATGVAVTLEVARLLGTQPTPRTLQLAFFDKEEEGLLGSKAFVSQKARLQNLRGVIVMDMVGYACYNSGCQKYPTGLPVTKPREKGDFLAVVSDTEDMTLLGAFEGSDQNLPPVLKLPIPFKGLLTPDTLRSDHAPFWFQGVGAVLVTDTANLRTPHYHKPSDKPKTIVRSFFTGSGQIVVNATENLLKVGEKSGSSSVYY